MGWWGDVVGWWSACWIIGIGLLGISGMLTLASHWRLAVWFGVFAGVPPFRSVSLSSRSVVPRLCFRDSPQVVYILYLVHGKFLTRFSNALGIFDTMI